MVDLAKVILAEQDGYALVPPIPYRGEIQFVFIRLHFYSFSVE